MMRWQSLLLAALLAGSPLHAIPKEPQVVPPPMAQPQNLSVLRGRSIEIPLRAQGRTPGQLKFLIRSHPSKGSLGEIRPTGPKTAAITYTHDGRAEGVDLFTFAVQAVDSAVSAAAPITLTISEEPPALTVVHSLNFGDVPLGETREEQLALRNSGGGVLEGRLTVPQPWTILGATEYRLGPNEETRVHLLFTPDRQRGYTNKLIFSHDARSSVELSGSGMPPFDFKPSGEIELALRDGSTVRSGGIAIRNWTSRDRVLEVSAPSEIVFPTKISVAAGEEKKIALHTVADFLGPLEGVIDFSSEGFRRSIPVRVFAVPPVLRVDPPEGFEFGNIEPRSRHKGLLRIKNTGGSAARLRATTPGEILLIPDPKGISLQPGEMGVFEVTLEAPQPGEYRSQLIIEAGAGEPVSVPISGRVVPPAGEAKKIPISSLNLPSRSPTSAPSGKPLSAVPPIAEIKVLKASNQLFEIGWNKPSTEVTAWIIQQGQFEITDKDSPKLAWRDLRNIKFLEENDMVVARFENLAPGQVWLLRIVSIDKEGRRSAPSPTIRLSSAPPKRPSAFWWMAGLLAAAALTLGAIKLRAHRQTEALHGSNRIARLESH
jgi:hypothetical protein